MKSTMPSKLPVSILIPARNEEANLSACLESVSRADEVFVVDSQSSDRSIEISEQYGATVVQFKFNGRHPKKKNWSLDNLPFRNEWVLIVDCDERVYLSIRSGAMKTLELKECAIRATMKFMSMSF